MWNTDEIQSLNYEISRQAIFSVQGKACVKQCNNEIYIYRAAFYAT